MVRGGYQLLDLQDVSFTLGTEVEIVGAYDVIGGDYRKPILITGIVIGGVEKDDCWVNFKATSTGYTAEFAGYTIDVAMDDGVTISGSVSGYAELDLADTALTSGEATVIAGSYAVLTGAGRGVIYVKNIKCDDSLLPDGLVSFTSTASGYIGEYTHVSAWISSTSDKYLITVESDNKVTITAEL